MINLFGIFERKTSFMYIGFIVYSLIHFDCKTEQDCLQSGGINLLASTMFCHVDTMSNQCNMLTLVLSNARNILTVSKIFWNYIINKTNFKPTMNLDLQY